MYDDVSVLRERARVLTARGDLDGATAALWSAATQTHVPEREYTAVLRQFEDVLARRGDVRAALTVIAYLASSQPAAWTRARALLPNVTATDRAMAAALRMRKEMERINSERENEDLLLKIGIHEGPCLAVTLNDRQDYFGQTVNIASRVQGLASSQSIYVTQPVIEDKKTAHILEKSGLHPTMQRAALRGLADETTVYEIP